VKIGAWIHDFDGLPLDEQIALAAASGMQTIRSYDVGYAERAAPALKRVQADGGPRMSLLAGVRVDAAALAADWRSQVRFDELARYHELGVPLEAVCVGNELREGGDEPGKKRFTARLSFGLANVLAACRQWLDAHGYSTPLTYAMEGIVFDREGAFNEWLWPLIDACDVVSLNAYPMDERAWFTFGAFEESRRFLHEARVRNDRLALFELRLRQALQQVERVDKPVFLSETGFPSAVGYRLERERLVVPESDPDHQGERRLRGPHPDALLLRVARQPPPPQGLERGAEPHSRGLRSLRPLRHAQVRYRGARQGCDVTDRQSTCPVPWRL